MDDLINLLYVSAASKDFAEEDLVELLNSSRCYNENHNITGMLLYCDKQFIQALEGPRSEVEGLFERIKSDTRHCNVLELANQSIQVRCFPSWSMGFRSINAEELEKIEGYQSYSQMFTTTGKVSPPHARVVFRLMETFKQTMCEGF